MYVFIYVTIYAAVPSRVVGISVIRELISVDGDNVTLALTWSKPFDNFNPILSYTVSCIDSTTCPPIVVVDYNTTSVNLTNLTPDTFYTFLVIATNSLGDGEAGLLNITTPSSKLHTCINKICMCIYISKTYRCIKEHVYK